MNTKRHITTERQSFEEILVALPEKVKWAEVVYSRLNRIVTLAGGVRVLDIGAAAGGFPVACTQLGYRCEGIEPWRGARRNALGLSDHLGHSIRLWIRS